MPPPSLVGGSIAVLRARAQTRVEMAASMHLAEALVGDAAALAHQQLPAEQFLANLPVQLRSIRHVRIAVKNETGLPIRAMPPTDIAPRASAPRWFTELVAPPVEIRNVPVVINGSKVGEVEIVGEPGDEIAEFWQNAAAMAGTIVLLNVAMVGILYVLFGRVLGPLTALAGGLSDLKRHSYDVRIPSPQARELAAITDHFNALASALETARAENLQLNRQLITAQDDERRRTALELHDEVGPCLFGLKANASSIASAAATLAEKDKQVIADRLRDTVAIVDHLQAINRTMLERLRPMALGHVPLKDMLGELVREQERRHARISFSFSAPDIERSYGDSIDLTIYRCLQESLTNAVRHAQAQHITIALHVEAERRLALTVGDDGCGIHPGKVAGFGMRGMQERVEGLGGRYTIQSEAGNGTCVRVTLPLAEAGKRCVEFGRAGRGRVMTSVLVIDDHPIVRQGCRRMLEDLGVERIFEAPDAASGYKLCRRHRPDVVIVDLAMQENGLGGLPLIRRMRAHDPHLRIIVFSMHGDPIIVARALEAGAAGYVLKDTSSEDFLKAFRTVLSGSPYLSHDLAMRVALINTQAHKNPLSELTPRELQTLSLLAKGKPYGDIAHELNVSYKTVVNVSSQLKHKLEVRNLPELIRAAVQLLETAG